MFNVTVIKGKDILKYLVKVAILVLFFMLFQKILIKKSNITKVKFDITSIINEEKLIAGLEQNIPIIKHTEKKENSIEQNLEDFILQTIVTNQLNVANHITTKETASEPIQEEQRQRGRH